MIQVRKMGPLDLTAVAEIERTCFSVPWTEDQLRESLMQPIYHFYVAEAEGKPAGYCSLYGVLSEGDICNIAVLPEFRRRGIGELLLQTIVSEAKDLGLTELTLEVRASNEAAIRLYEKHEFRPIGRRKDYYTFPVEDAVIYGVHIC